MATETVLLRPSATLLSQDATVLTPRVAAKYSENSKTSRN